MEGSRHIPTPSEARLDDLVDVLLDARDAPDTNHASILLVDHLSCVFEAQALRLHPKAPNARASLADSAGALAALHCWSDRDDVDWSLLIHPGAVVWPVVWTIAERNRASGREMMSAAQAGYEAAARLAEALGPNHRMQFHPTATAGTAAAAAAAAVMLGHSREQMAHALGHAISVMGGSIGAMRERSGTRIFHRSHAVRSGINAAQASGEGLQATLHDLATGGGVVGALNGTQTERLSRPGLGALARCSVRIYPTSGWHQTVYEAAARAAERVRDPVIELLVEAEEGSVRASVDSPSTVAERWWSLHWAAARGVTATNHASDAQSLARVVQVVKRAAPGARAVVTDAVGGVSQAEVLVPLGHPTRPASLTQLAEKWLVDADRAPGLLGEIAELLASDQRGVTTNIARQHRLATRRTVH